MNTIKRSKTDRIFAGICGGIAEEMGVNTFWIRLLFVIGFPYSLIAYIIGLMFMEK